VTAEHPDPSPPTTPAPELAELKRRLNIKGTIDESTDEQLTWLLSVADAWVSDRVYADPDQMPGSRHPEVVEAILVLASRLYARRNTPEGVAGWPELGLTRVAAEDPDLASLLEHHIDYTRAGVA
jgi:hypothetical protein